MKTPQNRGTPIDLRRYRNWKTEFASFRQQIPEERIRDWIGKFKEKHHDIVARVLDCVDFITHEQMAAAFRQVLAGIDGWHKDESKREGAWRFAAYSSSSGESGDEMISKFRHANNLKGTRFNEMFIHRSDIVRSGLGNDDTLILVDDFVGSGDQACKSWNDTFGELVAEVGRVFLVVVAGNSIGIERINTETELEAIAHFQLSKSDNFFHSECTKFNNTEKKAILEYCEKVDCDNPKGHGECGLLVVFSHTIPNNTIPILGKRSADWEPLFCRYD